MPPVLGPRSPSSALLWSMALTMGTTVLPSAKASTDTSGPSSISSMRMRAPLSPNTRSPIMACTAALASSLV